MAKRMISYSGGLGSFLAAHRTIQRHGREGVSLVFCDTSNEDDDLHRFNRDVSAFLGIEITVLKDGRTPWDIVFEKGMLNGRKMDCSRQLKGVPLDAAADAAADAAVIRVIGIDWSEKHRLEKMRLLKPQFTWEAPMCDQPFLTKAGMQHETERLGLRPPRMYAEGYAHNNCKGSCLKAGIAHWKHHLKTRPKEFSRDEANENRFRELHGDYAILKDRRGGAVKPLPLFKLRQMVENSETPSLFDDEEWGGCGCAIDIDAKD